MGSWESQSQLSVVSCQLSVICYLLSVICCRLSVVGYLLSVICCRLSVISYLLSVYGCTIVFAFNFILINYAVVYRNTAYFVCVLWVLCILC